MRPIVKTVHNASIVPTPEATNISPHDVHIADVPFVVVDIETTGPSFTDNRVIEIACVVVRDGAIIDEYSSLVNPRQHIPSAITRITGINAAMVWNAPEEVEVFRYVRKMFSQPYAVFVAHNVLFDWTFVQHSFARSSLSLIDSPRLCTYKLSKRLFPKTKRHNLGAVASYLDIGVKNRHRAYGDAFATAQVLMSFLAMLEEQHNVQTLGDLLTFQNKRLQGFKPLPRSIEQLQETLRLLPDEPGIYYFRSQTDEILYIGKAKSLKHRVNSYFQAGVQHSSKIFELVKQIRDVQWETTGTELSALLLESKEIKHHQPRYNTLIKRFRQYPFLRLGDTPLAQSTSPENSDTTQYSAQHHVSHRFPRLDICFEVADDGAEYYGPFGSRGAAEAVVDIINRTFKLRKCKEPLVPDEQFVPCFYHQIGRCDAPCAKFQTAHEYWAEVDVVRKFLSGERDGVIAVLRQTMHESSEKLEFEEAALHRNQMKELERVFFRQQQISTSVNENNVIIVLPTSSRHNKVEVFFIRYGRLRFQRLVGKKLPIKELEGAVEEVYFDGSQMPSHCRKEEIDEIRIIASWVYRHRDDGYFLYAGSANRAMPPEVLTEQLIEMLYAVLGENSFSRRAEQQPVFKNEQSRYYEPFDE